MEEKSFGKICKKREITRAKAFVDTTAMTFRWVESTWIEVAADTPSNLCLF